MAIIKVVRHHPTINRATVALREDTNRHHIRWNSRLTVKHHNSRRMVNHLMDKDGPKANLMANILPDRLAIKSLL